MSPCILIADDNHFVRKMIRAILEAQNGWQVCGEAENGRQAIEKAQELKPDVIVLDLSMPVMNGLEAAQTLKKLMPAVPLVMFTTFMTNHLHELAFAAGVNALVIKSDSSTALVDSIRSLLIMQAA
jgi:DNA-binding NarL/FixJ family response regulator